MKDKIIVIWGVGYIGFTDLVYYLNAGYEVVGIDVDSSKWEKIHDGECLQELRKWLSLDIDCVFKSENVKFVTDLSSLKVEKECVHLICVPTERDNEPWNEALFDVINKIIDFCNSKSISTVNLVIESTMIPGTSCVVLKQIQEMCTGKIIRFAVSPRRDWFVTDGGNLKNLNRVIGCDSKASFEYFKTIIGDVCDNLVEADDYIQAEITKSVENAIRNIGITLANQLADAFPDIDITRVLELAATKWNVQHYYPSFGIGGYCIPLAPKYLLEAGDNNKLDLLQSAVEYNKARTESMLDAIDIKKINRIGILGISYIGNIKVVKNSIIIDLIKNFLEQGKKVKVNDCMFSKQEIKLLSDCDSFDLCENERFDCLILFSGHDAYKNMSLQNIVQLMDDKGVIWDNVGVWDCYTEDLNKLGYELKRIGKKGWRK